MPSPPNKQRFHWLKRTIAVTLIVAWVTGVVLAAVYHQDISDYWRLQSYQAPAAISKIAREDAMTDYGRRIFYVNQPEITAKSDFSSKCPSARAEQTIVLGCYQSNQAGIYVLDVTDQRLDGVEQVTAAHEMLHAAYDRLSIKQRDQVNAMLEDYYKNDLHDDRILKTIDAYKKTEPNDVVNEMHSIFGTEIAHLPAPLEAHYKKYFTNRSQVATLAARYQSEFTSRQDALSAYDTRLTAMRTQIDVAKADLKARQTDIDQQQKNLVALKSSGDIAGYNAAIPAFNAQVDAFNAQVQQVKDLVSQYNQLVATRNAVALEENQLVKDLSNETPTINN
jgi:hypothetical protein